MTRGRERVEWLIEQGVPFTTHESKDGNMEFHLTREGGHSNRRGVHAADATGGAIVAALVDQAERRDDIAIYEDHMAIDLITHAKLGLTPDRCVGAYLLDLKSGNIETVKAKVCVLATGGAG